MPLHVFGTVWRTTSRRHHLCLSSAVALRRTSSGAAFRNAIPLLCLRSDTRHCRTQVPLFTPSGLGIKNLVLFTHTVLVDSLWASVIKRMSVRNTIYSSIVPQALIFQFYATDLSVICCEL